MKQIEYDNVTWLTREFTISLAVFSLALGFFAGAVSVYILMR